MKITSDRRVVAIVQARMGSTRLPGKVLRLLCGGPMLVRVIERLRLSKLLHQIVVATTSLPQDNPVAKLADEVGAEVFRGDEADVLGRYVGAARSAQADVVVRVTADCPLIDPTVVDQAVAMYLAGGDELDYVSNTIERTYPRGLDVEVFPRRVLEHLNVVSTSAPEREHVTLHLLRRCEHYRIVHVLNDVDYSHHYWTVDSEQDLQLVEQIYEALYSTKPSFGWSDVLALFEARPELFQINQAHAVVSDARMRALDAGIA